MKINYSDHSLRRMKQRGISPLTVEHIIHSGDEQHIGKGCKILFLNKKNRSFIPPYMNTEEFKKIQKQLSSFVVFSEENQCVITVAHRYKRIKK